MTEERRSPTDPNATAVREGQAGIAIGRMIGSYRIEGLLAQGGMGVVCRATDTKLGRPVAIKFLSDELDANARRRFQREAQMASALNHPHILTVHDAGEDGGRQYLVTEFVDGGTLADWMQNAEPRGWRQSVELLIGVADALAAAHAANILHRDVKPANILISKNGYAKLADFGLAKAADGAAAVAQRGSEQYTVMGAVIGTIAYMSPEQAAGRALDARSDIFSFGVVLYELLTGRRPFAGVTDLEVLQSVIHAAPTPLGDEIPEPLRRIVEKAIEKDPAERYQSMRDFVVDLRHVVRMTSEHRAESIEHASHRTPERAVATKVRRYATAAAASIIVLAGAAVGVRSWQQTTQTARVRSETIPAVAQLVEQGDLAAAFELAQHAARYVPDDPLLKTLTPSFTSTYSLTTTPPDAEVFVRGYDAVADEWQSLGRTPLASIGLPRHTLRWRIEKAGFETAELATSWRDDIAGRAALRVPLQEIGEQPSEMVFVPSAKASRRVNGVNLPVVELAPFFIDRYEVTNEAYKEFVDAGAYGRREYWEGQEFRKDGQPLSWDEAMGLFVDATGRAGPADWELGDYPDGEDAYPVTGVSWHEAMAYARFRDKSLPTVYHWTNAALPDSEGEGSLAASITALSNFGTRGLAPVGSRQSLGPFGTYDMHGNAREWILNQGPQGGWVLGGGFEDRDYQYYGAIPTPLLERSRLNGFRLVRDTGDGATSVAALREPLDLASQHRPVDIEPASDEVFAALASQFAYRSGALNASEPVTMATTDDWIKQRVTVDTGYHDERMDVVLFVPTRFEPPLQSVIVFFGIDRFLMKSSVASLGPGIPHAPMEYLVKSGRILVIPVFQGSFERFTSPTNMADEVRNAREWVERRWDLGRTIDYLETRPDADASRIAYYGLSFGAGNALPLLAVEPRLKVAVLLSGGLSSALPAAVDPVNYVPRITIPVLMMNGRFDYIFPLETSQLPLFNRLGTPAEDKRHVIVESGHAFPPTGDVLREILGWLDKYLGRPVLAPP